MGREGFEPFDLGIKRQSASFRGVALAGGTPGFGGFSDLRSRGFGGSRWGEALLAITELGPANALAEVSPPPIAGDRQSRAFRLLRATRTKGRASCLFGRW